MATSDRKSTRLDSRHTEIYTLSLHDALPIWLQGRLAQHMKESHGLDAPVMRSHQGVDFRLSHGDLRSEEHTSGLPSHRDLHSFPTRRSSDLAPGPAGAAHERKPRAGRARDALAPGRRFPPFAWRPQIGRAHVWTPVTPRSTLFPYTTLFRSGSRAGWRST